MVFHRSVFCVCAALLAGAGCGDRKTVKVRGVVTLDGEPLPRAAVLFQHQDQGGRDANGFTDNSGTFRLSTFDPDDGALPGNYKVVIQFTGESLEVPPDLKTPEEVQKELGKRVKVKKSSLTIPDIYSNPDKTVLRQKVPTDGEVRLALKSQP
jgi:hypothetical protein